MLAVVAIVTLLPGLEGLRTRLSHAKPGWLLLGAGLKVLSGLGYVAVFRMVFCRRMTWRVSYQIGMSELGANALFPTGGAGGLALGAWALKRGGMPGAEIARRTVAFFLLTSVANVVGVIVVGIGLAVRLFPGETNLALTALPAAIAAIVDRWARCSRDAPPRGLHRRLERSEAGRALASLDGRVEDPRGGGRWSQRGGRAAARGQRLADRRDHRLPRLRRDDPVGDFRAFGAAPPLAIVWIAYLIGELGGLIPVPGGIGGVDAGLVGTFVLYGVSLTSAASAVLAYRAIALWVPAVLGAVAFVALRRTLRRESAAIAVCAPQTEMEVIGLGRVVIGSPTTTP